MAHRSNGGTVVGPSNSAYSDYRSVGKDGTREPSCPIAQVVIVFVKREGSLPGSQKPATRPYRNPLVYSSQPFNAIKINTS
jgi:hypothetical protein